MDGLEHYFDNTGNELWTLNGKWHREDGPAVIWTTSTHVWCRHGHLHREDGPAVIYACGAAEWWLNNKEYQFDKFCEILNLTPEQIFELKIKHG